MKNLLGALIVVFLVGNSNFAQGANSCVSDSGSCSLAVATGTYYAALVSLGATATKTGSGRVLALEAKFQSNNVTIPVHVTVDHSAKEIVVYAMFHSDGIPDPSRTNVEIEAEVETGSKPIPIYVLEGPIDGPKKRHLGDF